MTKILISLLMMAAAVLAADFAAGLTAWQKGDYAAALNEWRPLAEQGSRDAQYNVGLAYEGGKGVPQNYAEAAKWILRAANQGQIEAQHDLGAMYGRGEGVKRDYIQAYKWMSICAAKGNGGCASQRDLLAQKLKGAKLADAQRLAAEWQPQEEPAH